MTAITARPVSVVTEIPPADPSEAHAHFSADLRFETDCWDVHHALTNGSSDFVLIDARGPEAFARGHVEGAINVPHRKITAELIRRWPADTVFVVYCAGPHCNGAHRAAIRFSSLQRKVKLMIGGITGWLDEGLPLVTSAPAS